jgi:hypothetical protein
MSLVPVKYPLDLTGAAASNRVVDEAHVLNSANIRVCVPKYGAFYTDSVALRDATTNRPLKKYVDYYPSVLYTLPTEASGMTVHQILVITDATCGANILFDAQMVGGEYSYSYDAIIQLVQRLGLDGRAIEFDNIIGKPDGYEPAPHMHDVGDVYGFEFLSSSLDRVANAITLGSAAGQKGMYDYIKARLSEVQTTIGLISQSRNTAAAIIKTLEYTPADKAGGDITGPQTHKGMVSLEAGERRRVRNVTVTASVTALDLSATNHFVIALNTDTALRFDVSKIIGLAGTDSIQFRALIKNDNAANRRLAFPVSTMWPNKTEPTRAVTPLAINEYEFTTYDGGVSWCGKLLAANYGVPGS